MLTFTVKPSPQFEELGRRLREASNGRQLRERMARNQRAAGRPVVRDLQRAVMRIDSRGVKGFGSRRRAGFQSARRIRGAAGLRATVARGAKQSVRLVGPEARIRFFMDNRHMPRSQRNLPEHLNNPRGWRHPVYKRTTRRGVVVNVWVRQFGEQYFEPTIRQHKARLYEASKAAVDETVRELGWA